MYHLARPLLFRLDAERAHHLVMSGLSFASRHPGALRLLRGACVRRDPRLRVRAFGLDFPNPIGLAAGFDKDGTALPAFEALGFGFLEAGSVTALPQPGNPRPRLFRLPDEGALINRMGFNNEGAEALAARLAALRRAGAPTVPLGVNVGKSKVAPLADAVADYEASLRRLWPHADYLALNVSSPNTPGLRELQARGPLAELLALVADLKRDLGSKPVLLKIAPDLSREQLTALLELVAEHPLDGLIATNTTVSRAELRVDPGEAGGLSGRPLRARSLAFLRAIRERSELPLVSVGGVADAADVVERLQAGATLVQLYTELVYAGPGLLRRLCDGLLAELDARGVPSVDALRGR